MKTLFIVILLVAIWVIVWWHEARKFQRNMKVGDRCTFYLGADKYTGRITYVGDIVHIRYVHGVILKDRSTVYPERWWI
jgi:predicted RNA-binding protein with PUA-like domain